MTRNIIDAKGNPYKIQPYSDSATLLINFLLENQYFKCFNPILSSLNGINHSFIKKTTISKNNDENGDKHVLVNIQKNHEAEKVATQIIDYIKHFLSPKNFINDIESMIRCAIIVYFYNLTLKYPIHTAFDIIKEVIQILTR